MRRNGGGQVGLLLLVVLGLVISIVLSIASRSLSDVVLSRQERENSVAFEVAESGVESALLSINEGEVPTGDVEISDSSGLITGQYGVAELDSFDLYVRTGDQAEIDLRGYLGDSVQINWTKTADVEENVDCVSEGNGNAPASLEVIALQVDGSVVRGYYNANGCSLPNGFDETALAGTGGLESMVSYSLPAGAGQTEFLRLRPFYSGATIRAEGAGLALQMYLIQSSAEGEEVEKEIEVKRSRNAAGSIFDYALFSGSSIIK